MPSDAPNKAPSDNHLAEIRSAIVLLSQTSARQDEVITKLAEGQTQLVGSQNRLDESVRQMSVSIKEGFTQAREEIADVNNRVNRSAVESSKTNWGVVFTGIGVLIVVGGLFVDGRTGPTNALLTMFRDGQARVDKQQDDKLEKAWEMAIRNDQTLRDRGASSSLFQGR